MGKIHTSHAGLAESQTIKQLRTSAIEDALDVDDINQLLDESGNPADQISRLRFALRLKRWVEQNQGVWPLARNMEEKIADISRTKHN